MTAPDQRVGEIEDRLAAVPAKGESQFVGLALPVAATTELWNLRQLARADVYFLLAELRKAHEALLLHESFRDLIMALAEKWEVEFPSKAADIRAAVAAANGDGRD